jgi:hypothetical protein
VSGTTRNTARSICNNAAQASSEKADGEDGVEQHFGSLPNPLTAVKVEDTKQMTRTHTSFTAL